jgi:hypothetical protein
MNTHANDPAATLRLMMASPKLADALFRLLPLARREYSELAAVAAFSIGSQAQRDADQWLAAIMHAELALKEAIPPAAREPVDSEDPADNYAAPAGGLQLLQILRRLQ